MLSTLDDLLVWRFTYVLNCAGTFSVNAKELREERLQYTVAAHT